MQIYEKWKNAIVRSEIGRIVRSKRMQLTDEMNFSEEKNNRKIK